MIGSFFRRIYFVYGMIFADNIWRDVKKVSGEFYL
jgi:hypothetical protein